MFIGFEIYVIDDNNSKHPNLSLDDLFFIHFACSLHLATALMTKTIVK